MVLFLSVLYISSNHLRDYINTQLSSHAQDAATSLGIAISSKMAQRDRSGIETHVNAMFDSGYYRKIEILDVEGQVLFIKTRALTDIESVPAWVIQWFPLQSPEQTAGVMDGWTSAGSIKVTSFPEFAYQNLWNNIKSLSEIFALTVLLMLLLSSFALRFLLRPLSRIEQQAAAISMRQFTTLNIRPATAEFRRVVEAMNQMSAKLKAIFSEQAALTEELQIQAFQDEVTGLSNRSVFMKQLKYMSESEKEHFQGCLLIMQVNNLVEINKKYGHLKGNQLLQAIAGMIQSLAEDFHQSVVARISGTEFAIIIKLISPDELEQLGSTIQSRLNDIALQLDEDKSGFSNKDIAHSGIILTYPNQSMGAMLSEVDMALRLAQQKGLNAYHIYDENREGLTVYGAAQWHDIITEAIASNHFEIHFQSVVNQESQVIQKEAMIRLQHQNKVVSAGIFIPMAEYLGITRLIDQWVIEQVFAIVKNEHQAILYSINLSQNALTNSDFIIWLKLQLNTLSKEQQCHIAFEIPEYNVNKFYAEYRQFVEQLKENNIKLCIDHFGIGFANLKYLHDICVDFIKIHGSFSKDIEATPEANNYLRQVVSTAHSLDIKVVAEGIENQSELENLQALKLDLFQGFYIGRPEPSA
jgi:diguanylate cyclase (GGDEF)-like protein